MINYYNTKVNNCLTIYIKAYLIDYVIVYTDNDILNPNFGVDEIKMKIPVILGVNKNQKSKIVNHVLASIHDYRRYLEGLENVN